MIKVGVGREVEKMGSQVPHVRSNGREFKFRTTQQQAKQTGNSKNLRYLSLEGPGQIGQL